LPITYFGRRVLVAVYAIECAFGRINDKRRRVVAEEALTHVDHGFLRGSCGLVDDRPESISHVSSSQVVDQ